MAAGICPNPLGELTALASREQLAGFKGAASLKERGGEEGQERKWRGRERRSEGTKEREGGKKKGGLRKEGGTSLRLASTL